jgi:hypothetical protein
MVFVGGGMFFLGGLVLFDFVLCCELWGVLFGNVMRLYAALFGNVLKLCAALFGNGKVFCGGEVMGVIILSQV